MELIFLGTSSGTPTKTRNVSGAAIRLKDSKKWCLVDCGEGTQHQILRTNLSLSNLQAIYITHVHGDHSFGLPGLLASASMSGRTEKLEIIGPKDLQEFLDVAVSSSQMKFPYAIEFIDVETIKEFHVTDNFLVEFIELSHRVQSFAYGFYEKNLSRKLNTKKLAEHGISAGPVWGKIQNGENVNLQDGREIQAQDYLLEQEKPRKIIISGDNDTPELLFESAKSANVLVHESTYTQEVADKVGPGPQHSSAKSIAQFSQSVGVENLILTHFSPRYQDSEDSTPSIREIESEAREFYKANLFLANDLDVYQLDKNGVLAKLEAES